MRTRREQVQAYRFVTRRISSALLFGEPETTELPMRRLALALFGSVMVAAIVFAGVGVYGLLNPGGRVPQENALIIERETGAKYVYLQGKLHPVLNYTSARLILGQANPTIRAMSRRSLEDVPRGLPVGIPDVPDALPERSALLGLPWSVCSSPLAPTSVTLATHLFVGQAPAGGSALAGDEGLLVTAGSPGDTELYLLWRNHRLRVRNNTALAALDWAATRPVAVSDSFLNAVPPGPDLFANPLGGEGTPGRAIGGGPTTVGQIFRAGAQHYVMLRDGLSPIGEVTARLRSAGGRPVTDIAPQVAGQALVNTRVEPPGFPAEIPDVRSRDGQVAMACAGYRGATGSADQLITVETFATAGQGLEATAGGTTTARRGADGVTTADRIVLPGGHAALVSTLPAAGSVARGNVFLVTDQGVKYPLPRANSGQVQEWLGYGGVAPVAIPASILALVPTGPALDQATATQLAPPPAVNPPPAPTTSPGQ